MSKAKSDEIREILDRDSSAYAVLQFDKGLGFYLNFNAKNQFFKDALHTRLRALVQKLDQEAVTSTILDSAVN